MLPVFYVAGIKIFELNHTVLPKIQLNNTATQLKQGLGFSVIYYIMPSPVVDEK
jgi:hypothetical protein